MLNCKCGSSKTAVLPEVFPSAIKNISVVQVDWMRLQRIPEFRVLIPSTEGKLHAPAADSCPYTRWQGQRFMQNFYVVSRNCLVCKLFGGIISEISRSRGVGDACRLVQKVQRHAHRRRHAVTVVVTGLRPASS